MKNETLKNNQNYLRKIKMLLKENVLLDLYVSTVQLNQDIMGYISTLQLNQDINQNSGGLFDNELEHEHEDEAENEQTLY